MMRNVWKTIEKLTQPCHRKIPFIELRCGDIIEVDGGKGIITRIYGRCITVLCKGGRVGQLGPKRQLVIRQSPDHIKPWVLEALTLNTPISVYLIKNRCPQCGFVGWTAALTGGKWIITQAGDVLYYPGIRRQLREFLIAHPEVKGEFGTVKWRYWQPAHQRMLLQLCPECKAKWNAFPLADVLCHYIDKREGRIEPGQVMPAFDVEIEGLFNEGKVPRPDLLKEARKR